MQAAEAQATGRLLFLLLVVVLLVVVLLLVVVVVPVLENKYNNNYLDNNFRYLCFSRAQRKAK